MNAFLFQKIDNAGLILFRIFFGILISLECYGALLTGWVKRNLVDPKFTFTFIGFEWLSVFTGSGMYAYFFCMGTLGILIALGYKYRVAIFAFTLLWAGAYLMQKTAYNNHYYLLLLIASILCFFPANAAYSLDAKYNPKLRSNTMYAYFKWIIVLQLCIVYTFASVAKLYADWLDYGFIKILMQDKAGYPLIGGLLQELWVHQIIAIFGIVFDFLIIPALLWKPTRKIAFLIAIFFHLFNSIVFQIGIFPYLALAFTVFFFEPQTLRKIFFKKDLNYPTINPKEPKLKKVIYTLWMVYFLFQIGMPLRHHFITDAVVWTEEGHRLSWRMMLRTRGGTINFTTVNKKTKEKKQINLADYLTSKQQRKVSSYPDFIWQFAQHLKQEALAKNEEISVFVRSSVSINGKAFAPFIDPTVDLAKEEWHHFKHHSWILPSGY